MNESFTLNMLKYSPIKEAALLKDGKIYTGINHAECFKQRPKGELRNAIQGFVTEDNFFVNRKEALSIAEYFNQIKFKHEPKDELLSEDLI